MVAPLAGVSGTYSPFGQRYALVRFTRKHSRLLDTEWYFVTEPRFARRVTLGFGRETVLDQVHDSRFGGI